VSLGKQFQILTSRPNDSVCKKEDLTVHAPWRLNSLGP